MPSPSGAAAAETSGAAIALALRLLAQDVPGGIVLLVSGEDGRTVVEEAWPAVIAAGQPVRMPPGLAADRPVIFDAQTRRLPVGWTEMLGTRPTRFAAAPVGARACHLVVASVGDGIVAPAALARWAELIDRLLGREDGTARRIGASRRLAALIDSLPLPLVFVDGRTIEVFLNDRARQLLDMPPGAGSERAVAASLARLVSREGDGQAATLAQNPMASLSFAIDHAGRHFTVESQWIREEELTGRLWLFHDVTDAHRVARFRDELVSTVSHELRTPLTSILGALTLLGEGKLGSLPEDAATLVDIALRNGRQLLLLVNDLLDLDKAEAQRLDIAPRPSDLSLLLADAIVRARPFAQRHGATVMLDAPYDAPTASVDPDRMLQVAGNLISNAIKFSPEGGRVTVSLARHAGGWRIGVTDEGPGVPPAFRDQLFTRFARGEQRPRGGTTGTGLGLAISKAIVEAHGGTIALDAQAGPGATFHVDLPAAEEARGGQEVDTANTGWRALPGAMR